MEKLKICLADDDEDDRMFFQDAFTRLGLDADLVLINDGDDLMHYLEAKDPIPDILFLDLNMPRRNGFRCLCEIKQSEKLKSLPVVILSTSYQNDKANALYEQGAAYYIQKPDQVSHLKDLIQRVIIFSKDSATGNSSKGSFVIERNSFSNAGF